MRNVVRSEVFECVHLSRHGAPPRDALSWIKTAQFAPVYRFGSIVLLLASCMFAMSPLNSACADEIDVWLGTSASRLSKGIYHCRLDSERGRLSESKLVAEISGPGFLALHPRHDVLYAVGALADEPSVVAYKIASDASGASLSLMNSQPIGDGGAAHLAVDATGSMLITAQYGAGSVAVFPLRDDGSLGARSQLLEHEGAARVHPTRQEAPHAHWAGFSPDNRFAFVPDLGLDQVVIYRVDADAGRLTPHGHGDVPPGAGPRHMKFHPGGKWIYVLNELDLSVTVFDYDAQAGTMTPKQTIRTVSRRGVAKEQFATSAEIRIHPTGKFVYASNRGHDTITAFSVAPDSGELTVVEREHVRGATPRNFALDPSARWLLAGGQDSHTLASFAVNQETGELVYNRSVIHTPSPICVLFDDRAR